MRSFQEKLAISVTATANIAKGTIIDSAGANSANKALGIAKFTVSAGEEITAIISGTTEAVAGSAIAVGDYLTADADGKAIPVTVPNILKATPVEIIGKALEAATAEDEKIMVLVMPQLVTGSAT